MRWHFLALLLASSCATVGPAKSSSSDFSQHLSVPFHLRGADGLATILYGTNHDSKKWGFDHLGLPFDLKVFEGYPVFEAAVEYPGDGYRALMGWVQLVSVTDPKSGAIQTSVDQLPWFRDTGEMPFMALGNSPTAFDAPGPNPPRTDGTWTAFTFLTVCPDIGRTKRLLPIAAVKWGYVLVADKPTPFPVEVIPLSEWDRLAPVLRETFPSWQFLPAGSIDL